MKSFDLTFSGIVLPERDPAQVKLDFAQFFSIQDLALVDEIFSGKTIVLRQNLDRRTAAEFFSKITQIGGQAALVTSPEVRTTNTDPGLKLEQESSGVTRIVRGHQKKSVEKVRRETPLAFTPSQAVQENDSRLDRMLETGKIELTRLRERMSQMREDSRRDYARLQLQKEQLQRTADEELSRIEQLMSDQLAEARSALAAIHEEEDAALQALTFDIAAVEEQEYDRKKHAHLEDARLKTLQENLWEEESAVLKENGERLESTRTGADNEVRRLQQLIEEVRQKASLEIAGLEQQAEAIKQKIQSETAVLDQQKVDTQSKLEQDVAELQQRQQAIRQEFETETAALQNRRDEHEKASQQQLDQLREQALEIKRRRDTSLADIDRDNSQLELNARQTLKELYSRELEVKRRYDETLLAAQNREPLIAEGEHDLQN